MGKRESILVSACLLGEACRYDGGSHPCAAVIALESAFDVVTVCPERLGGLPTPRVPSEIQPDGRVFDKNGDDNTDSFEAGARATVEIALRCHCKRAVLKSKSPSCGVREVYDGTFTGTLVPGEGVTARALRAAGVDVMDEKEETTRRLFQSANERGAGYRVVSS